jgi:hypothetical protein
MLVLSAKPNKAELLDIEEQNRGVLDGSEEPGEGQGSPH